MAVTPIQEKAYSNIQINISTINKLYFNITYIIYYNFNPMNDSYSGLENLTITIPISNINVSVIQSQDNNGSETSCAMVIKNNEDTVITLSSNDWFINNGDKFTIGNFINFQDYIYSASIA